MRRCLLTNVNFACICIHSFYFLYFSCDSFRCFVFHLVIFWYFPPFFNRLIYLFGAIRVYHRYFSCLSMHLHNSWIKCKWFAFRDYYHVRSLAQTLHPNSNIRTIRVCVPCYVMPCLCTAQFMCNFRSIYRSLALVCHNFTIYSHQLIFNGRVICKSKFLPISLYVLFMCHFLLEKSLVGDSNTLFSLFFIINLHFLFRQVLRDDTENFHPFDKKKWENIHKYANVPATASHLGYRNARIKCSIPHYPHTRSFHHLFLPLGCWLYECARCTNEEWNT